MSKPHLPAAAAAAAATTAFCSKGVAVGSDLKGIGVIPENAAELLADPLALTAARGKRNETQEKIRPVLVQYRKRIAAEFPEGSAIRENLPAYSPPEGSTPDAVQLSGSYDAAEAKADLAWSEVTDDSVTGLELRGTVGPEYDAEDETVIATFAPGDPRAWTGDFGLLVPGSAASFKLYSVTAEGNERGSNAVTVTRPLEP